MVLNFNVYLILFGLERFFSYIVGGISSNVFFSFFIFVYLVCVFVRGRSGRLDVSYLCRLIVGRIKKL